VTHHWDIKCRKEGAEERDDDCLSSTKPELDERKGKEGGEILYERKDEEYTAVPFSP
jgi:hypothetical protein